MEPNTTESQPKKRSGCSCLLIGCFAFLLVLASPFIGTYVYLATLDEEDAGEVAVWVIENREITQVIKDIVRSTNELSGPEKEKIIDLVYKIRSRKKLDDATEEKMERNLARFSTLLFLKIGKKSTDDLLQTEPYKELIKILGGETPKEKTNTNTNTKTTTTTTTTTTKTPPPQNNNTTTTTTTTTNTTSTTKSSGDPFDFERVKDPNQKSNSSSSPYDF